MEGDAVDQALSWIESDGNRNVAFVSAANEKRPGGDWETGVLGYEVNEFGIELLPRGCRPVLSRE